ncbi:MAG: DNA topoisomerase IB [Solirubrobacterales bacterium]
MARLKRADCSGPGIRRVRRGRGFSYIDELTDERVSDEPTLERIAALVIPPAWKEVWICSAANGHIQATGFDDAGRKQYLYHDRWRHHRDREKFESVLELAALLPTVRSRLKRDLKKPGLARERVLATAVRLLDLGFFRIGSEQYAEENETYGLATLRKKHVSIERGKIVFEYTAKNSQKRVQVIDDKEIVPIVRSLKNRTGGGYKLLAFKRDGEWQDVRSDDINEYLKQVTGGDFTAKDFRTWNATVLAAIALVLHTREEPAENKAARKRIVTATVKSVSDYLGNTPAVCRASYIDPRVFDRFDAGDTIEDALDALGGSFDPAKPTHRLRLDAAVLTLVS